jgi:hypothetical protein
VAGCRSLLLKTGGIPRLFLQSALAADDALFVAEDLLQSLANVFSEPVKALIVWHLRKPFLVFLKNPSDHKVLPKVEFGHNELITVKSMPHVFECWECHSRRCGIPSPVTFLQKFASVGRHLTSHLTIRIENLGKSVHKVKG